MQNIKACTSAEKNTFGCLADLVVLPLLISNIPRSWICTFQWWLVVIDIDNEADLHLHKTGANTISILSIEKKEKAGQSLASN